MLYANRGLFLLTFLLLASCTPFTSENPSEDISSIDSIEQSQETSAEISNSEISVPVEENENPYYAIDTNLEREEFYSSNYARATSFIDAKYRTAAGLISGDITDSGSSEYPLRHEPLIANSDLSTYKVSDGIYTYDDEGNYQSYQINTLNNETKTIYYGGAYVTLEDVAAYLFAFAEVPANNQYGKYDQYDSIAKWWIYGRVNNSYFSANTDKYQYEPDIPNTDFDGNYVGEGYYRYYEMDFGYTELGWTLGNWTYERAYNNGQSIDRGPVRFVFTATDTDGNAGAKYIPVEDRHVFLTTNHYNDFTEYLNFTGGWGMTFGWMSAGNEYCASMSGNQYGLGYYEFDNPVAKTSYSEVNLISLNDLIKMTN